ncbi:MAG: glycoside hydrolase family 2 TIM barrel-domain containing protein [Bacteroidota bacterium]
MKNIIVTILSFLLLFSCTQDKLPDYYVEGISNPVIDLSGTWKINTNPTSDFWKQDAPVHKWKDVLVPGELMMQGFAIKHDQPFVYKKEVDIPSDYENKSVILQFDGVYSYARVWVNGNFVRDHSGGFTRWDCDITPFVKAGKTAMLTVEVTDKADEISYASGYAKHPIGGILRGVRLMALPVNYPTDITIITDLDEDYQHATLMISGKTIKQSEKANITLELLDVDDKKVELENNTILLNSRPSFQIVNHISNPLKWDAEHPNLYKLKVSYHEDDQLVWHKVYKVGFRKIYVKGNRLLVNGKEVKLKGANRHDVHPMLGRVSVPVYELMDVLLAKEANMNFIRTSHYPPTDNFLSLCDEYGIYVEDETAVCFVGSHRTKEYRPGSTENNPDYNEKYMSQLKEMVTNHKNHPSVIIWSIGNENSFGNNFKESYDWAKETDNTRPVIFSYPGHVPDSVQVFDVLSMHYPGLSGTMNQIGKKTEAFGYKQMPVIFDEWAHVACYNNFTVKEDPNVRDFWGMSLDSMWQKTFEADGGLGGAIWGMIDETFMLPDTLPGFNEWWGIIDDHVIPAEYTGNNIGYGEWGIIDIWRRKKPEFWNTKKAYSPVKILKTKFDSFSTDEPVLIPVYNRFDHTNINELTIKKVYKGVETQVPPPDIEPHAKGTLSIIMQEWDPSETVSVEFYNKENQLIDKYMLRIPGNHIMTDSKSKEPVRIEEDEKRLVVQCENETSVILDKETGLINEIRSPAGKFSVSGPTLNLRTKGKPVMYSYHTINEYDKNWQMKEFYYEESDNSVAVTIKGEYEKLSSVSFKIKISSNGEIEVAYQIENMPQEYIRELGIKFELENKIDSIGWERNPYWSYYPDDHLSARKGTTRLYAQEQKIYRADPQKSWNEDSKSFYYDGIENEVLQGQLTNKARATKENIYNYELYDGGLPIISVVGNGDISCRIAKHNNKIKLFANNEMDYVDLSWGNYQRNILFEGSYSNAVVFKVKTLTP